MKLGELVDEAISQLAGFTTDVAQSGTLTAAITAGSTDLVIDFGQSAGAARPSGQTGMIEIDRELIEITSYDPATMTARCAPWGRGARNTTAVMHAAGSRVTVKPRYPRKQVADVINQVVAASCPPLWPIQDLAPIVISGVAPLGFDLPAGTVRVLRVEATWGQGVYLERALIKDWTVRTIAGVKQLELPDRWAMQNITLQITVVIDPGRMTDEGNDFADKTGLPESCTDLVLMGALGRLVLAGEASRLAALPPDASQRAEKIGTGSGTALARYYQALYTQRLDQELSRQQTEFPIQLLRRG